MWRLIWTLIILVLSVWLGLEIAKDPGLALFTYRHWSVEMPLWFAVLCFIAILLIGYFILRLLGNIDIALYRWKNWLTWRRKNKSYSKTNRGLIELLEGRFKNAEYYLSEGIARSDAPLINYLALAKAAHSQGNYEKRDLYLRKAHASAPQAEIVIGLTQAQLQLDQGLVEQALATLNHLRNISPKHGMVLKLLERLYIHLGDWENLLKLLPSLYKTRVITKEQYYQLEKKTYQEMLASHRAESVETLHKLWEKIPRKYQKEPQLVYSYVKQLINYPEANNTVEELIYKTLKKSWDAQLVKLYGLLVTDNPKKQLAHAESLLKKYPHQSILLLTLGRLCVRCQLWGKARSYFEDSLKLEANAEAYTDYGKLLEQLGDTTTAMQSYRDGLGLYSQ